MWHTSHTSPDGFIGEVVVSQLLGPINRSGTIRASDSGVANWKCTAVALVAGWIVFTPAPILAADATASIQVQAQMSSRTALTVSTQNLHFSVTSAADGATASVDFSAAARTHAGADVMLSIEVLHPSGGGDEMAGEFGLTFAGEGEGTLAGDVAADGPSVAARWNGSGRRAGRLVFTLRAPAAGAYTVPVRFVLATP
jgi:hypothetical protein